ncbi:MAG: IS1 family transposase [Bacteroidetes bacterium]|nr:MAG: IS1 family transposase [Bacteroidota bacterium]
MCGKMKKTVRYCYDCKQKCHRHGKIKNKQRWKCKNCGLTQFSVYKRCIFTPERKDAIKRLNSENVGIRGMARLLGLSPTHVIRCILQLSALVKRPDYYEYGQEYELDELWSYSECKNNPQWVVWAINRKTRVVIDFVVGRRTKETVNKLVEKLKRLHPKKIRTDKWAGYKSLLADIPKEIHRPGRRITNILERQGATVRNSIKRLNRKTLSFSKTPKMLEACILLYMDDCKWRPYRSGFIIRKPIF